MLKKVLAIAASPRKGGNSDILCDQFLNGAKEAGHSVEKIYLHKEKLGYCMGCYACRETKKCVQKDKGNEILQKMVDADVILFASPVYFYSVNGQLKTLIDRTLPRYQEFSGKAYLILTAADSDEDAVNGAVSDYESFLRMTPALKDAGHIYGLNAWSKADVIGKPSIIEAFEAGKNI